MTAPEALGIYIPTTASLFIALAAPYLTGLGRAQRTKRLESLQAHLAAAAPGTPLHGRFKYLIAEHLEQAERAESKRVAYLRRIKQTCFVMLAGVCGCGVIAIIAVLNGWDWLAVGDGRVLLVLISGVFFVGGSVNLIRISVDTPNADTPARRARRGRTVWRQRTHATAPAREQQRAEDVPSASTELASGPEGTSPTLGRQERG